MNKKTVLTIVVLIITGCLILSVGLIAGVLLFRNGLNAPFFSAPSPSPVVESPTPGAALPTPATTAIPGTPIPSDIASQMDEIQQQVMSYRALKLKGPFTRELLTPDQLKQNVINDFFNDYTPDDAARDSMILAAFGLLSPGFDLQQFYIDLYSEQVAGYYDNKTRSMYVIAGESFGGTERMVYAHEFTHTLQDQNYDIENGLKVNTENCKKDTEYCAAVSALMEGDASLSEYYWFAQYSSALDKQQVQQFQQTYTSPVYDSAPEYMKQDFLFPYTQGYDFVNALYAKNEWQSIDDAFLNPPVSTEQILHPEKYPSDKPIVVDVPDFTSILGTGWTELDRNVMGEWYASLILDEGIEPAYRLDAATAKAAAAGWGGDTYVFYADQNKNDFVMVWQSLWETTKDANEFWAASLVYGNLRWGTQTSTDTSATWEITDSGIVTMRKTDVQVLWTMTPSTETQASVLAELRIFGN